ncbi:F0F1 ATP synthase subunit delta [Candidatus Curculioniphilus buchneri]|uniref:F0F1 ATP synthase subunit delta n=1 Tax=Candidatus Curculioniphilus buchneri TaxID=690594 RepID=UPI00376F391F
MSQLITLARPYAEAIFSLAVEQQNVDQWQSMLMFLDKIMRNELISTVCSSPASSEKKANFFISICGNQLDVYGRNLIRVIAKNNRLTILPNILEYFIYLRLLQEQTVNINIMAAAQLTKEQLKRITFAMERRFSCRVNLNFKIDQSVVAGIVIYIGDTVIDGSVRGRQERFAKILLS